MAACVHINKAANRSSLIASLHRSRERLRNLGVLSTDGASDANWLHGVEMRSRHWRRMIMLRAVTPLLMPVSKTLRESAGKSVVNLIHACVIGGDPPASDAH